jgi:2'-5' RNA ligase
MKNLYLTAILPPAQLSEQIDDIRKECAERFNVKAGLKPPVHITLYRPFFLEQKREAHLVKLLLPVTDHVPFEQELENFNSFHMHTLFVRALKNPFLSSLQRSISSIMSRNKIDPREVKGNTLFNPHITIAYRDIPPEVFPLMWAEYRDRKFKRSFTIDGFTLLKHDRKKWNIFREFRFKQKEEVLTLF